MARTGWIGVAVVAAVALLPAAASADVRHAHWDDPQDVAVGAAPDVRSVDVDYDRAGSLTVTTTFYAPVDQVDPGADFAFAATFVVGTARVSGRTTTCDTTAPGSIVAGQHHVWSDRISFYDRAALAGSDTPLSLDRAVSADGRTVTVSASSDALARRDYTCLAYAERGRHASAADAPGASYDDACACWVTFTTPDVTGPGATGTQSTPIFFDGFAPVVCAYWCGSAKPGTAPRVRHRRVARHRVAAGRRR